jgi:hypothetical protein
VKFPVRRLTKKTSREEHQTHGYEVDLVGARQDRLVLATVKSFFGSRGVVASEVTGLGGEPGTGYMLLNDKNLRKTVVAAAARRYGYKVSQVELRLYAGRFAAPTKGFNEAAVREWCAKQRVGSGPIGVFGLDQVVDQVVAVAEKKQYRNHPVLVTIKVLQAAGRINSSLVER